MAATDGVHNQSLGVSSSGDNTAIAAVTGHSIRVLGYVIVATGAVTVQWFDGPSSDALPLSGVMSLAANGVLPAHPVSSSAGKERICWFKTRPGKALVLKLGGAVAATGHILYELV